MKIFYVTSVLGDVGGSEIYTRDLLMELIRRGHELNIFTTCDYDLPGAQMNVVPTFGHHAFHKFQGLFYAKKALKIAKEFKPDIVSSHSNSLMGFIGSSVKKKFGVPHLLLIELISSENYNLHTKTIHLMEKNLLPQLDFDKIVVWTNLIKEKFLLPWGVKEEKIEIIPPAINIEKYSIKTSPKDIYKIYGKHLITSLKSLWGSSANGIEYIIEAMPFVLKKNPDYKYVIFGGGKEKENLEKKTRKLGLEETVLFHGWVKPEIGGKIAAATTVSPHSFVYEISFSMSLMEFLAFGVPCVVTDIGSAKEIVRDTALLVEPKNPKAIADGINRLIEDRKLRSLLGKKSRELVKKEYSIKKSVDRIEEIYFKMLKNKK